MRKLRKRMTSDLLMFLTIDWEGLEKIIFHHYAVLLKLI